MDKHRDDLAENLRLYINLDMNHVDAERNSGVVPKAIARLTFVISEA